MPFSKRTVPKAIEYSQYNPRSGGQQEADKIQKPGFLPDPSEQVKEDKAGMKDREENIKKFHPS